MKTIDTRLDDQTAQGAETSNQHPSLLPILLIIAVDVMGFSVMIPLLPLYAERFGASALGATSLLSLYNVCQFVSAPLLGNWSDAFGRKKVLLVSQFGSAIGFLTLAGAQSLPMIFLARLLDGITAGNMPIAQAYISDISSTAARTRAFSKVSAVFGTAMLLGPAIGAALARISLRAPMWAAAVFSVLSLVATAALLPKDSTIHHAGIPVKRPFLTGLRGILSSRSTRGVLGQLGLFYLGFSVFTSGLALFMSGRVFWHGSLINASVVASVFAYTGLLNVSVQIWILPSLVRLLPEKAVSVLGFGIAAFGYAVLSTVSSLPGLIAAVTFASLGTAGLRPVLLSALTTEASHSDQGLVIGANQSLMGIAGIFAPLVTGYLLRESLDSEWALTAAVLSISGLVIATTRAPSRYTT